MKSILEYGSVAVATGIIAAVSALSLHARSEYKEAVASREERIQELDGRINELTGQISDLESDSQTLRALLNDRNTMVIALDSRGNIVEWNPACERRLGWTENEMLGQTLSPVMFPEDFRKHTAGFRRWITDERNRGAVGFERCIMVPKVKPPFDVVVRFKAIGDFRNGRFTRAIAFADPSRKIVDVGGEVSGKP